MPDFYEKEHELLQLLYQNTSLQGLCNKMAQLLGTPVAVGDFFRSKIVLSQDFPEEDFADQLNRLDHLPRESRQGSLERLFCSLQDRQPHMVELAYMRKRRLCCGIFHREHLMAFLEIPDTGEAFAALDSDFVKVCSDIMGLVLQFNRYPFDRSMSQPYALLWNHFNLGAEHKYSEDWRFCPEFAATERFQLLRTDAGPQAKALFRAVDGLHFQHWTLPLSDSIVCLADAGTHGLDEKVRELALTCGVVVGMSCVFTDLNDLDGALRQARCSADYARKNKMEAGLASYNDYKLQDLLAQAERAFPLDPFCDDVILRIRDHDRAHQTEYERTLRVYLMNSQSIQAAADLLFVHKNTVIYRIGKLRELFGVHFSDCRQLAQLYCSFLIAGE